MRTALAGDKLGVTEVVCFTMAAATQLTVVAGVVPTGIATTGLIGISLAFVVIGGLLGVFAAGFVAMCRHISNAGAFYAIVARGVSGRVGVGAAWVALLSYNCLQVGLYGIAGAAAAPIVEQFLGLNAPWWGYALIAWSITAVLGMREVTVNGRVLAVLLAAEIAVIVVFSIVFVTQPGPEGLSGATFQPDNLFGPGLGALLVMAVLAFVGFESSAVYAEESRNRFSTIRTATYAGLVVTGLLYAGASWALSVAVGPSGLVQAAQTEQTELFFALAADRLGPLAADVGHVLFVTSVLAALISFHHTCARYTFALGREHVLPAALGRTSRRSNAPVVASGVQSLVGLAVIVIYAVAGLDPVVQLFFYLGAIGGIGVLALLTLASVAVFLFFTRHRYDIGLFASFIAPVASAIALVNVLALAVRNLDVLLGIPAGHPLTRIIPVTLLATLGLGTAWGNRLRITRPDVYAVIGMGADSATHRPTTPTTPATGRNH